MRYIPPPTTKAIIARMPKIDNNKFKVLVATCCRVIALVVKLCPLVEVLPRICLIVLRKAGAPRAIASPITAPVQVFFARVIIASDPPDITYIIPPITIKRTATVAMTPIRLFRTEVSRAETVVKPIGLVKVVEPLVAEATGEVVPVAGVVVPTPAELLHELICAQLWELSVKPVEQFPCESGDIHEEEPTQHPVEAAVDELLEALWQEFTQVVKSDP